MSLVNSIKEDLIKQIFASYKTSEEMKNKFVQLINEEPQSYAKHTKTHFTSSVLVIDETHENLLLLNHKKYNQWLAFGGHWNDTSTKQETIHYGAIRELFEEAYDDKVVPFKGLNNDNPISLDVHQAADHVHYDVAFLVEVDKSIPFTMSKEAKEITWVNIESVIENRNGLFNNRLVQMAEHAKEIASGLNSKIKFRN